MLTTINAQYVEWRGEGHYNVATFAVPERLSWHPFYTGSTWDHNLTLYLFFLQFRLVAT